MSPFDLNYGRFDAPSVDTYLRSQAGQTNINGGGGGLTDDINSGIGLGFNMPTMKLAIGGITALGNFWNAMQANKLAKEQFNYTKGVTNQNMANQIKSYNTTLSDRINARAFTEGRPDGYAEQYMKDNRLERTEY